MKRVLGLLFTILAIIGILCVGTPAFAGTTTDVVITWTPEYISISVDDPTWAVGAQATSAEVATAINAHVIDNTSSVNIDVSIKVIGDWTGGGGSTAADDGAAGANTVGLKSGLDDLDDLFDVIVKKTAAFNNITTNQTANTDFNFGLKIYIPTSFIDGTERTNTVRLTATKAA